MMHNKGTKHVNKAIDKKAKEKAILSIAFLCNKYLLFYKFDGLYRYCIIPGPS